MPDLDSRAASVGRKPSDRLNSALLGAAIAVTFGGVGLCVPFVAAGSDLVFRGVDLAISRPTAMVLSVAPWGFTLVGSVGAILLVVKERLAPPAAALATNAAALVLAALVTAAALLVLVMPLIQMGRSLLHG